MADLGKAYIQILPSTKDMVGKIESELGRASSKAGTSSGLTLAGKLKGALMAAGIGKAVIDAVKLGAAYEQSVGGVETLFKKSSDMVIANADKAFRTAGISANAYMEQATSFSASLLQSLDGDTKKAAKMADMAILDMGDNANKMGSNIADIQNAYQGFAKQNYTMLDNLKLGYGGTRSEMQRLLGDASKLTGKKYDISNLADVYEAIHVVQKDLGITGTTAKEAATTLSGSFLSMKAAAEDFAANLVNGRSIEMSVKNLATSASTFFFGNLLPALGRMVMQLPSVIGVLLQTVAPQLIAQILKLIPQLLIGIGKLASALAKTLTNALNNFANGGSLSASGKKAITGFARGLVKAIPIAVKGLWSLIKALIKAALKLPGKLLAAGVSAIKAFVKGLKKVHLPRLKISWSTESKGSGKSLISIPKPHLNWYKSGGIFSSPSVIGVGEAGSEAVVPLKQFWSELKDAFNGMPSNGGSGVLHVILQLDGKTIGETAVEYINGQTIIFGSSPINA